MHYSSILLIIVMAVASFSMDQPAYGHDCPLQQMGRLETFRSLDQDKDGRLTLKEFMTQGWCQEVPSCQCQEAAKQFFSRLDKNGDGFVTIEEFQAASREKPQASRGAVKK